MFGVSPAYFISRYGTHFSPDDVAAGLKDLFDLGYRAFQLEVYHAESTSLWTASGFSRVASAAAALGMTISQCVGHVLLNAFSSEETLFSPWGIAEAAAIAAALPPRLCPLLTIPIPAFAAPRGASGNRDAWRRIEVSFIRKLAAMVHEVERCGLRVALEVLPGSLVGGIHGFLYLSRRFRNRSLGNLGFNLDTGHAWASREPLGLAVARLGSRITGTHLCDNWATENLSLAPGTGGIDWVPLLATLESSGYKGSYDIEIHCAAGEVQEQYANALEFLRNALSRNHLKHEETKESA